MRTRVDHNLGQIEIQKGFKRYKVAKDFLKVLENMAKNLAI